MKTRDLHNERELLLRIAAGDEAAFQLVFDHYRAFIYSFVLRVSGDEFLAAELVQDTFLKVWLKKEELPHIKNFPGWIYTIAERFTYSAITKTRREKSYFDQWLTAAEYSSKNKDGNDYLEERDYQSVLNHAINRLPPKQKETYLLIKEQGLQRTEVARALQVSPETVKWNLEKAMTSIRAYCLSRLKEPGAQVIIFLIWEKYF